jgi:hypothetical protein
MVFPTINNHCNVLKDKFKNKFPTITDEDLQCCEGQKDEMLEKLRQRLRVTASELRDIISEL